MTGEQFKHIRKLLGMERTRFALEIGYLGNDRNNDLRIRRLEAEEAVPLYIGRLVYLLLKHSQEHNGNLPHWPKYLQIEEEDQPWT